MKDDSKLLLIKELVDSAESNIQKAKSMINEMVGGDAKTSYAKKAESIKQTEPAVGEEKVIEGIFDGEKMTDEHGENFPVPANYASKSKLVPGDALKLSVNPDGSFVYKQIGPVERKQIVGTLTYEDNQYKVVAGKKSYKVLLASITYYKGEIGDKITLIVPENEESAWGAIDNVLPRDVSDIDTTDDF